MKTEYDTVVIGGGVVGCSILFHLTELGVRDVALLERTELTAGSTWHAAANMHRMNPNARISRLQSYSGDLYRKVEQLSGQACGIHQPGGLYLASSRDRLDELKLQHSRGRYLGIEFEMLTPDDVRRINPLVNTDGLHGAMFDPWDMHLDPNGLTNALAIAARKQGAEIHRYTEVTGMQAQPHGGWSLETTRGPIKARRVVNAAGLWAREVGSLAEVCLPLQPMEHQYIVTDSMEELEALDFEVPLTRDYDSEFYSRQEGKGLLIGAYERDCRTWADGGTPLDFGQQLLAGDLERMEPNLLQAMTRIPALGRTGIKQIINGPIMFSPDGYPLLGPVPGKPDLWVCVGVLAGFSQSGGLGMAMAHWIVHDEPPMDLYFLDVARFGSFATRDFTRKRVIEYYGTRYGIGFPHLEREAGRPLKTTPLYDAQLKAGAVMGSTYGIEHPLHFSDDDEPPRPSFRRPSWFAQVGEECRALRSRVGLIDLSRAGKLIVEGKDAERFLLNALCGPVPREDGTGARCFMLNKRGGFLGDFHVYRTAKETFLLLSTVAADDYHLRWLESVVNGHDVSARSVTDDWVILHIAGPRTRELMRSLLASETDLPNHCDVRESKVGSIEVTIAGASHTGDEGFDIFVRSSSATPVYEAIQKAGAPLGLTLVGTRALDSLRLEAGIARWGSELSADIHPAATGLDHLVDDSRNFIGREAVFQQREKPAARQLVILNVDADGADANGSEPIMYGEKAVGSVSSGGFGHTVGQSIAMAYVDKEAVKSNLLHVEIIGQRRTARICRAPLELQPRN